MFLASPSADFVCTDTRCGSLCVGRTKGSRYLLPLVSHAGATTDTSALKEGGATTPTTFLKEGRAPTPTTPSKERQEMTLTLPFKTVGDISDSKVDEVTPFKESSQVFLLNEGGETSHPLLENCSEGGTAEVRH